MKLSQSNLDSLDPSIERPHYNRRSLEHGIVHIGVGGFHRAHQAAYAQDLLRTGQSHRWGICGVGLLPRDQAMRDAMMSQDCLYTLVERGDESDRARVIGSITGFLFAPDSREAVLEKMAGDETKIVSLTITEGGYYIGSDGELDARHPDIVADLESPRQPRCSFGFLLEALDLRRRRGAEPFTVMSCDNIQSNGDTLKKMLLAMAELRDPTLASWMERSCLFPNSMVDRITPATTPEHREMVRGKFGIEDACPVVCERFQQWVIEDRFVSGRPAWESVGVQIVGDVLPYEKMKLRLLNASHQALCYIGLLLGHSLVHQAMGESGIRALLKYLMDREVTPLLPPVPGVDLDAYKATLIARFASPAIEDQLARLAIYGSSGMPRFVLPSIEEQLARGGPISLLCFCVATWLHVLSRTDIALADPMAPRLRAVADPMALLEVREVFGEPLARSPRFVAEVRRFVEALRQGGARATLESAVEAEALN